MNTKNLELHKVRRHCVSRTLFSKWQVWNLHLICVQKLQRNKIKIKMVLKTIFCRICHLKRQAFLLNEKQNMNPFKQKRNSQWCMESGNPVRSDWLETYFGLPCWKNDACVYMKYMCVYKFFCAIHRCSFYFLSVLNFAYSIQHLPNKNRTLSLFLQ